MINTRKIAFQGVRIKKEHRKMPYTPSLIQTILSVPESHRFLRLTPLADYTAGGESHPAPKTNMRLFSTCMVPRYGSEVNSELTIVKILVYIINFFVYNIGQKGGEAYAGTADDRVLFRLPAGEAALGL